MQKDIEYDGKGTLRKCHEIGRGWVVERTRTLRFTRQV